MQSSGKPLGPVSDRDATPSAAACAAPPIVCCGLGPSGAANLSAAKTSLLSMSLRRCLRDHRIFLDTAAELLGEPARAVDLSWEYQQLLLPHLVFETRRGILGTGPVLLLDSGRPGHELVAGLESYRVGSGPSAVRLVRVSVPTADCQQAAYYDFWAVGQSAYRSFYRALRRLERRTLDAPPPMMLSGELQRLQDNTIGFLRRDCRLLKRYGVPQRRGLLLLGRPGNGKTMACRWIRAHCQRRALACRNVSAEEFSHALAEGQAHSLFQLGRAGVIFFDDFDSALRDRDTHGTNAERSSFLGGLDGIHAHHGVVYVFTSNARLDEIDPAIRRPGRLDVILHFMPPCSLLRGQLIAARWHEDLRSQLPVSRVIQETEGLSFAELDELKKLLALQQIETGRCEWDRAWSDFHGGRAEPQRQTIFGFAAPSGFRNDASLPQTAAQGNDENGTSTEPP